MKSKGYTPRWMYAIVNWVEEKPLQGWLGFAVIWVAISGSLQALAWQRGALPKGQLDGIILVTPIGILWGVAAWAWGDRLAKDALPKFLAFVGKSPREQEKVIRDFASLPEKSAAFWGAVSIPVTLTWYRALRDAATSDPIVYSLTGILFVAFNVPPFIAFMRIFHQLLRIQRMFHAAGHIDLFNLAPIYSLSRYTTRHAILLAFTNVLLFAALFWDSPNPLIGVFMGMVAQLGILTLFLLPLREIARRIRLEKEERIAYLNLKLETMFNRIHKAVEKDTLAKIPEYRWSADALQNELNVVKAIPTWPWNPGTLRNLLVPLLLPLIITVLQRYVLVWLGF